MSASSVLEQKDQLVDAAPVSYTSNMFRYLVQAHFRYQLINEDDDANGADKTS